MSNLKINLKELYSSYKRWVCENPETAGEVESVFKWISYFVVGRINDHTLTELIYSISNLFVLFNDLIIHSSRKTFQSHGTVGKLKVMLTVLEYSEVFIEISARKLWGESGKWIIVVIIQLFKCIARLSLLLKHKENILSCPPVEAVKRNQLGKIRDDSDNNTEHGSLSTISFTLKNSGKVIRKVNTAPSITGRTWKPPVVIEETEQPEQLTKSMLYAEALYITKPVVHLGALLNFGQTSWKPWLLSLAMDLTSLYLMSKKGVSSHRLSSLSKRQRLEVSRRSFALLLYLMRSPCYDRYSKNKVNALLDSLARNIPLARLICNPVKQYIPYWQEKYFYLWSS